MNTLRFRCIGRMYSSFSMARAMPVEIASCPIPENHLDILPCRSRINIFSSIILDFSMPRYRSSNCSGFREYPV